MKALYCRLFHSWIPVYVAGDVYQLEHRRFCPTCKVFRRRWLS